MSVDDYTEPEQGKDTNNENSLPDIFGTDESIEEFNRIEELSRRGKIATAFFNRNWVNCMRKVDEKFAETVGIPLMRIDRTDAPTELHFATQNVELTKMSMLFLNPQLLSPKEFDKAVKFYMLVNSNWYAFESASDDTGRLNDKRQFAHTQTVKTFNRLAKSIISGDIPQHTLKEQWPIIQKEIMEATRDIGELESPIFNAVRNLFQENTIFHNNPVSFLMAANLEALSLTTNTINRCYQRNPNNPINSLVNAIKQSMYNRYHATDLLIDAMDRDIPFIDLETALVLGDQTILTSFTAQSYFLMLAILKKDFFEIPQNSDFTDANDIINEIVQLSSAYSRMSRIINDAAGMVKYYDETIRFLQNAATIHTDIRSLINQIIQEKKRTGTFPLEFKYISTIAKDLFSDYNIVLDSILPDSDNPIETRMNISTIIRKMEIIKQEYIDAEKKFFESQRRLAQLDKGYINVAIGTLYKFAEEMIDLYVEKLGDFDLPPQAIANLFNSQQHEF